MGFSLLWIWWGQHNLPHHEMEAHVWQVLANNWGKGLPLLHREKAAPQGERTQQQPQSRLVQNAADLHPSSQAWIWRQGGWQNPTKTTKPQILILESLLIPCLIIYLAPLSNSCSYSKNGLAGHETVTESSCFILECIRLNSTNLNFPVCSLYILVVQWHLHKQSRYPCSK